MGNADWDIVYVARQKPTPGRAPSVQIMHTLRGLCRVGPRITYVTPWPVKLVRRRCLEVAGHELPENLRVVSVGSGPNLPVLRRNWPSAVWSGIRPRLTKYLQGVADSGRPAVVYTRNCRVAAEVASEQTPPVVFESHEFYSRVVAELRGLPLTHPVIEELQRREREALARCAGLVTVTAGQIEDLRSAYGYQGPSWVIPNGAEPEVFEIPPAERRPCPRRLLYVGSLIPWKGLDLLLHAIARVPEAELHICGGKPGTRTWKTLVDFARSLGVLDRIRMHGTMTQRELRPWMASSVAGILTIDGRYSIAARYTSPLKLFEYLCAGLPIVATDLPSVREIVGHEREALLFPDRDVDDLARALRRVLSDKALAARLSENARATSRRYTWQCRGERIVNACRAALELQTQPVVDFAGPRHRRAEPVAKPTKAPGPRRVA